MLLYRTSIDVQLQFTYIGYTTKYNTVVLQMMTIVFSNSNNSNICRYFIARLLSTNKEMI